MKVKFWRILLALGMTSLGFALGAFIGSRFFVTRADGIVGGAMVFWYGILGAVILLIVSIILGLKLRGRSLPVTALGFALLPVVFYGYATFRSAGKLQAELGTESEYTVAGKFTATMQRLELSDPNLFVKMEVDSRTRKWIQTGPAPKHETYTASLRAKTLVEIRSGLDDVAELSAKVLADCRTTQDQAIKRLSWDLMELKNTQNGKPLLNKGVLDVSAKCLREHSVINRALRLVESASRSPVGDIKRK